MNRFRTLIIILLLVLIPFVFGENLPDYEPYEESEFPEWALDLRRGEVIFFGTIPFTFFISSFSYDVYKYADSDFDPIQAPAIFGNKTPPILIHDEKLQIVFASVIISAALAFVDYLLGEPWND
jgi:hypothetical protein